jgi:hypothetical protein
VAERPQHVGVALGRRIVEDGAQVGVRLDLPRANERFGSSQQARLGRIAANASERGQL